MTAIHNMFFFIGYQHRTPCIKPKRLSRNKIIYLLHLTCTMLQCNIVTCHQRHSHSNKPSPYRLPYYIQSPAFGKPTYLPKIILKSKTLSRPSKTDLFLSFKFSDMLFDQKSPIHAVLGPCLWHKTRRRTSRHKIFLQFLLRTKLCPGWANVNGAER